MTALVWDNTGERYFETGVQKVVLYPKDPTNGYTPGVAWNGVISINDRPSGAEPNDLFADDIKYATLRSAEEFGLTIEAYTYPDEWAECDGSAQVTAAPGLYISQQTRKTFGLCYRTRIGSDENDDLGYKLHLVYGCTASPSEKQYQSVNDNPDAITFSWEIETVNVPVTGTAFKPTSYIVIDSRTADATKLAALETKLYGGTGSTADPQLPLPATVISDLTPASAAGGGSGSGSGSGGSGGSGTGTGN